MPLFRLQENRYVNTDYISEAHFNPSGIFTVRISSVAKDETIHQTENEHESWLRIDLNNKEVISLTGAEADAAWAALQAAMGEAPGGSFPDESLKLATDEKGNG